MFQFSDAYISELLAQIYDGTVNMHSLPSSLYYAIADSLKKGIYEGFGGDLSHFENTPDFELLNELRTNTYMFSAAKTYQQVKQIGSLLVDGDRVRTRSEFNKIGRQTFDTWNVDYGNSEYNTAIASASMASKWNDIELHKELLPVISYSTIGDACDICKPLGGLTLPVGDAKWNAIYPPNHFNCMCIVTQHDEIKPATPPTKAKEIFAEVTGKMQDSFKMNSGKDGCVFSPDHPYFDVPKKDKEYASRNFDLPIPETDKKAA